MSSTRRAFLQTSAAGIAASGLAAGREPLERNQAGIPLRPLGKTGEQVTLLCLGGFHSTVPGKLSEVDSIALIQRAVDEGITFLDNAWDYHDGVGEERMGKALAEGGRRDKVFLMTKVCGRTAKESQQHLEDSLRRLRTDRIDLWQFHEIVYDNDPDWIFEAGGAIETALKAKEQGKIRYLGFTGHKDPRIHLKMLGKPYPWATVQMPLNVLDAHYRSFQKEILPVLAERGIGAIGMKSLGGDGRIVTEAKIPVETALRYVMSLPIATLVTGIDSMSVLEQNLAIARSFEPLSQDERNAVDAQTVRLAGDGR
jgi:predicted aldo/keto reductase-like oxidoreductase